MHPQCGYRIPDRNEARCKGCFWIETSKAILSSVTQRCSCQDALKALNEKLDHLLKKNNGPAALTNKHAQPQHQLSRANVPTPQTPRSRDAPFSRPRRQLNFAGVVQRESRTPRNKLPVQRQTHDDRPKNQRSSNARREGPSRFTALRATEAEVPPRIHTKALSVSQLHKLTTDQDVIDHVRKIIPENASIRVTRLESEHQNYYATFHIAVPAEHFADINDGSVWPMKVQFRLYRGKLHDYRKFGFSEDKTGTESPRRKLAKRDGEHPSQ